jgi:hypothetical protein
LTVLRVARVAPALALVYLATGASVTVAPGADLTVTVLNVASSVNVTAQVGLFGLAAQAVATYIVGAGLVVHVP